MTKKRPDFKTMMETGTGLSGFEWPENCGDFDFVIKQDGTWLYNGTPIGRKKLCQLFAITLQKNDEGYWLVTPVERGKITVEDAPFFVVEVDVENSGSENQILHFRTTLDWWITAGENNKIWVENDADGLPNPYIYIRDGLHARLNRNTFYELCNMATVENNNGTDELIINSNGCKFSLGQI